MDDAAPVRASGSRARGDVPEVPPERWWHRLTKPFWVLPAAAVASAVAAGVVLPVLEESWAGSRVPYLFQGGPDGARAVLTTISTAMISVTGVVFSITIVVLQLASSQFTPRALPGFLQSRVVQGTLGVFLATFVFSLTVTRAVRGTDGAEEFVPQASVTVAYLLVLACVGFFLGFIHHVTTSIQVAHVIDRIGDRTLRLAEQLYPGAADEASGPSGATWSPRPGEPRVGAPAPRHGVLTQVDYAGLVAWARDRGVVVTIDRAVGQFIADGEEVLRAWGIAELDEVAVRELYDTLRLGSQRELHQDVAFGIRQLVDIADRALSPGINDPTTAVRCLDELHRVLRHLVQRASPSPYIADADGAVRVVHRPQTVDELIDLAAVEIARSGADTVQVPQRMRLMFDDLLGVAAPQYRAGLQALARMLDEPAGDRRAPGPGASLG